MANKDNPLRGKQFEIKCNEYFYKYFKDILFDNNKIKIGLYNNRKDHKFDFVSNKDKIIIECKSHSWTEGNYSPSAKMSVWNEAMYYFSLSPKEYRKILFVKKSLNRNGKSLARYYKDTYNHLIPENTEIWEFDVGNNKHEVI